MIATAGWEARLSLGFRRAGDRTVLADRRHYGPLVVQKPLYPEGPDPCHAVLIHAPGGIAGGDRLVLEAHVSTGARAVLLTPAATKWYRSAGAEAAQRSTFIVDDGAVLEYLPQETIVFDAAEIRAETRISLDRGAVYAGWEVTCLGRIASGERFRRGTVRQRLLIERAGSPIWSESAILTGGDELLTSPVGLAGCPVFASFVVAAGEAPAALVAACRALPTGEGDRHGISALPEILVARYLGYRVDAARDWFERLWAILRPWYAGCGAARPRLWNN